MFVLQLNAWAWCGVLGSDKARCGFLHEWNILVIVWLPLTVTKHCTRMVFMDIWRGCLDFLLTVQLISTKGWGIRRKMRDGRDTRPDERNSSSSSLLHPCGASGTSHHCHQELPDRKPFPVLADRSLCSAVCRDLQWEMYSDRPLY